MTEYLIFGVSYSEDEKHIEWVHLMRYENGKASGESVVGHSFVVDLIKNESASFRTAIFDKNLKKIYRGAEVHIYDDEFLATNRNATDKDNLSNLPRFIMPTKEIEESLDKMFS